MSVKTTRLCDLCSRDMSAQNVSKVSNYDVCEQCRHTLLVRVFAERTFELRPWCTSCGGTGKVDERNCGSNYDRPSRDKIPCVACRTQGNMVKHSTVV